MQHDHKVVGLLMKGFDTGGNPVKFEWELHNYHTGYFQTNVKSYAGAYTRATSTSEWSGSVTWSETFTGEAFESCFGKLDILKNGVSMTDGGIYAAKDVRGAGQGYEWHQRSTFSIGKDTYSMSYAGGTISDNRGVLTTTAPAYSLSSTVGSADPAYQTPHPVGAGLGAEHPPLYNDVRLEFEPQNTLEKGTYPTNQAWVNEKYWNEFCAIQIFTNNVVGIRYKYNRLDPTYAYSVQRRTEYFALSSTNDRFDTGWHLEATYAPYPANTETIKPYWVSWNPRVPELWLWEQEKFVAWL